MWNGGRYSPKQGMQNWQLTKILNASRSVAPLIKVQSVNMMNICKLEVSKVDMGSGCEGESQRGKKKNLGRKSSGLMQSMEINSCLFYEANKPTCTSWISLCRQAVFILYVQYINRSKVHLCGLNGLQCVVILLTLKGCWLQPWGWWGFGSSCPGCLRCHWIWDVHFGPSASSPALTGAGYWGSP